MKNTKLPNFKKLTQLLIVATFFSAPSTYANETSFETLDTIKAAIESFVTSNTQHEEDETVTVSVNQFEAMKLPKCQNSVQVSFSNEAVTNQSKVVLLECSSTPNWRVFVPIQVQIMTPVLTVDRMILVGDILTENDVSYHSYDRNRLYDGYFRDKDEVVGLAVVRTLMAGAALTKKNLKQMPLVKKNQTITLLLRRGAIEIEMIGIAKSDGYMNTVVKVLNPSSKKIVDAVVTGQDRAEIS